MSPLAKPPEFPPPRHEAGYTYEEIAGFYGVVAVTVARWFNGRDKEKPTARTVRITPAQFASFRAESKFTKRTVRKSLKKKRG